MLSKKANSKRSRSTNWSESEKTLLTRLIKEKIHLIENKDVSKNNNHLKKSAWQEVLQSFNQLNDVQRDLAQLVNQWRNTKNNIKKRQFEYKRNCKATGGGPRPPSPPLEDLEILEILPQEFEVDSNIYDSDSLNLKKEHEEKEITNFNELGGLSFSPSSSRQSKAVQVQEIILNLDDNEPDDGTSSSSLLPLQAEKAPLEIQITSDADFDQRKPNKNIHCTKKMKKKAVKPCASHQERLFLIAKAAREQQMKNQEEEHKLKIEIMKQQIKNQEEEQILKIEMMKTEHKLRVQVIKKEMENFENK